MVVKEEITAVAWRFHGVSRTGTRAGWKPLLREPEALGERGDGPSQWKDGEGIWRAYDHGAWGWEPVEGWRWGNPPARDSGGRGCGGDSG